MLNERDLLLTLRRHWDYEGKDFDISHEIYHDDAVLEFPQSGERFEGVENFKTWRKQYPANLRFHTRRVTHRDDVVVAENLISYDGAPWMHTVNLLEFRGDKVAHERIYIMDGWEAAEWRALAGADPRGSAATTPLRCPAAVRREAPPLATFDDVAYAACTAHARRAQRKTASRSKPALPT